MQRICMALGVIEPNHLAKEWHALSGKFAGYAHRSGIELRNCNEFDGYWEQYKAVLEKVLGNNYRIFARLDTVINSAKPTQKLLAQNKCQLPLFRTGIN